MGTKHFRSLQVPDFLGSSHPLHTLGQGQWGDLTLRGCFPRGHGTLFAGSVAPFVAAGHEPPGTSRGAEAPEQCRDTWIVNLRTAPGAGDLLVLWSGTAGQHQSQCTGIAMER